MAAPKGNQFWKLRSKHGREKIFTTPEILWEAATEYFAWCDKHPWMRSEAVKGGVNSGKVVEAPVSRPYTLTGLCLYLDVSSNYFRNFKGEASEEFMTVITRIEEIIYTQKFEGAAVGAFNANIIARDLGLADKKELAVGVKSKTAKEMTDDELASIAAGGSGGATEEA